MNSASVNKNTNNAETWKLYFYSFQGFQGYRWEFGIAIFAWRVT